MKRTVTALLRPRDDIFELAAPAPGRFRSHLGAGDVVRAGIAIGELEILGQLARVLAPDGAHGAIVSIASLRFAPPAHDLARRPVEHGGLLFAIDPRAAGEAVATSATTASAATLGLVFRAPTSGRFYGRPAPDKPPFVTAGMELAPGTTICLLEVMKTFHRVTYGGAGLPERARVSQLLVADGADVSAGDALLALEGL